MESSNSMDKSFRARVQKVFGSLSSSHSPWALTDDEVEKREWSRGRAGSLRDDDEIPCSSSFDGVFAKDRRNSRYAGRDVETDLDDLNDDGHEKEEELGGGPKRGDGDDIDEWEIRSAIGMDSTLDNEEEEDEYDKVAEGRENAGDRLYMKDVNNHGLYLNSYNVLPSSLHYTSRDPRANHFAASIRVKEDEVEAQEIGSNTTSDKSMSNAKEPPIKACEDGGKLKSILKRKDDSSTSKEKKRVRFDPGCTDDCKEASEIHDDLLRGTPALRNKVSVDNSAMARDTSQVPDYTLNPSKYTRYSFDSASEVDDGLNSQGCMGILKLVKMSKPTEWCSPSGDDIVRKPVTFIPRKKATGARPIDSISESKENQEDGSKQSLVQTGFPLGIAAGETQVSNVDAMEDELETNAAGMSTGFQRTCRHYRTRSKFDDLV